MIVSAPMNEEELRNLMFTSQLESTNAPFSIRYPRGNGVMSIGVNLFKKFRLVREEKSVMEKKLQF